MKSENILKDIKIGFIGGGNMAEAILRGMLAGGAQPENIFVAEPLEMRRESLSQMYRINTTADNSALSGNCAILILAVKPQVAGSVLAQLGSVVSAETLIISIMAGVPCSAMEKEFAKPVRIVRAMPNTPALVLQGASALCKGSHATGEDMAIAEALFALVGTTCRVDEKLMDAVTGLSGSGPAYVLTFIEALADGGVKNGLPRETALNLASQTLLGTARLLMETGEHPGSLRDKVTSPGGTTIAGLHALEKGCFRSTVVNAVDAATARSIELGK